MFTDNDYLSIAKTWNRHRTERLDLDTIRFLLRRGIHYEKDVMSAIAKIKENDVDSYSHTLCSEYIEQGHKFGFDNSETFRSISEDVILKIKYALGFPEAKKEFIAKALKRLEAEKISLVARIDKFESTPVEEVK